MRKREERREERGEEWRENARCPKWSRPLEYEVVTTLRRIVVLVRTHEDYTHRCTYSTFHELQHPAHI